MTCSFDIEPFRSQVTPRADDPSSNELFQNQLEDYLTRLVAAITEFAECVDENCCDGGGGGGGAESFLELSDTPASYSGFGGNAVIVNDDEDGLEFGTPASGPDSDGLTLDFSTDEQETNRTWIDGRTIYQKTIDFGALPNSTFKDVAHGITDFDFPIAHFGWAYNPSNGQRFPIPFAATVLANVIMMQTNATDVRITTLANRTAWTVTYVTLFYVKTP